jgi:hypothetical protein
MEDVIDVMEDLLTKVVEMESRRNQSHAPDIAINLNPVKNKEDGMEVILLDDLLPKAFEFPNEANVQVDPLRIDNDSVAVKKEPVIEMVDRKELAQNFDTEEGAMENFDAIDLAMEVVEEIVVEEVVVGDELDEMDGIDQEANIITNECEEKIIDIRDVRSTKVEINDDKCPQVIDTKVETSRENGNDEDGDDEHDDGDDEYDDDDDEEEEQEDEDGKDIKRDKLPEGTAVKSENKKTRLFEQPPEGEVAGNVIPEVSVNRRSSQESTTTTTTTTTETSTAGSSSSSSESEDDSSSSNEDSSNSSSNSDSDNISDAISEEAKGTPQTVSSAASGAFTNETKSKITAKGQHEKNRGNDGHDEHDTKHGMYDIKYSIHYTKHYAAY